MLKIISYFGKSLIAGKLLTSSILITLLLTVDTTVLGQPTTDSVPSQLPANQSKDSISQKLLGQWEGVSPNTKNYNLIFSPDGNLYIVYYSDSTPDALAFKYRIEEKPQINHLDVTIPNAPPVQTIFEFTADGQLRVQLEETSPGNVRPSAFSGTASIFKKISDNTTLPKNIDLTDPFAQTQPTEAPKPTPEAEAKNYIGTMNRSQQAYYLENQRFARTLKELQIGIKPETENYRYQIIPQKRKNRVIQTATAKKPQLKSYTGIVYTMQYRATNQLLTIVAVCETDKPSTKPPVVQKFPTKESEEFKCPAGSSSLKRR